MNLPGTAKQVVHAFVLFSLGISLSVLFGLITGRSILTRWVSGGPSMVWDTCLGAILAGVGLWLAQRRSLRLGRSIAGCLLLLGCLNLVGNGSKGLANHLVPGAAAAGSMAPAIVAVLLLLGTGLLLHSRAEASLRAAWVVAALGMFAFGIG